MGHPLRQAAPQATVARRRLGYRASLPLIAVLVVTACSGSGSPDTTAATVPPGNTTAPTTAPTTTPVEEPSTTVPAFPPQAEELTHGGLTWAVVLAGASDPSDQAIVAAEEAATAAGYTTGFTDCDEGAAEALGMPGGTVTISVYFDTEEYARAAQAAFAAQGIEGEVAEVRTMCLD